MSLHVLTLVLLTVVAYIICGVYLYHHTRNTSQMVDVELDAASYPMLRDEGHLEKGDLFTKGVVAEGGYLGGYYDDDDDVVCVISMLP